MQRVGHTPWTTSVIELILRISKKNKKDKNTKIASNIGGLHAATDVNGSASVVLASGHKIAHPKWQGVG